MLLIAGVSVLVRISRSDEDKAETKASETLGKTLQAEGTDLMDDQRIAGAIRCVQVEITSEGR